MFPRRIVRKTIEGTAPPTGTMPPKAKSPTPSVENNPITISLTPDRLNYSELQAVEVLKVVYKDLNEISGIDTQLYSEQHTASTIPRHMLELQCQGDMREINNLMGIARKFRQVIVKDLKASSIHMRYIIGA
ncbi:MAG: hypothetical protein M1825_002628 [Sarcosagium campestre]|nr:MAG: hypothetical protein M1825_002628 [Sarcosagium campestre]